MTDYPQNPPSQEDDPYAWLDRPAPWHSSAGQQSADLPQFTEEEEFDSRRQGNRPEQAKRRVPIGAGASDDSPRVSRVTRRWARQQADSQVEAAPRTAGGLWQISRTIVLTLLAGLLIATIFSYWTPDDDFLPEGFQEKISVVDVTQAPGGPVRATPLPTEVPIQRIGIIAGHSGPPLDPSFEVDPGAVCDDNQDGIPELTELQINQAVADQVATKLRQQGYLVDLLNEFDERLAGYRADVLVSIHTNDCTFYGFDISGYSVAGPAARGGGVPRGEDEDLVSCIRREYGAVTGLPEHGALTEDMTSYHTFREISVDTPVAIIEIGFMYVDRQFLTQQPGVVADGIVSGILCYLEPLQPAPTPTVASADTLQ